jgi:hypothetical protein
VKPWGESGLCPECKLANSDRPTRKRLIQAITAAFEPSVIRPFLASLAARYARIRVIEEASSELDHHLPPKPGVVSHDTFLALFDGLDDIARYAVFDFYAEKIASVDRDLRREFVRVFR